MKLSELVMGMPYLLETRGDLNVEIEDVTGRSKEKVQNGLFFCIPGQRFDAHDFAPEAVSTGCVALVVERYLDLDVPQVLVSSPEGSFAGSASRAARAGPRLPTCLRPSASRRAGSAA